MALPSASGANLVSYTTFKKSLAIGPAPHTGSPGPSGPIVVIPAAIYRSTPPHGVLFEQFWAPASECPEECFLALLRRKKHQKALKKHSLGAGAQNCRKSTLWSTFRPGPRSTPVNGGRDRQPIARKVNHLQRKVHQDQAKHCCWRFCLLSFNILKTTPPPP